MGKVGLVDGLGFLDFWEVIVIEVRDAVDGG